MTDIILPARRPRSSLHAYQVQAADFLIAHPEAGLFLDPGLGKTVTTLTAFVDLKAAGAIRQALVVGPPRVVATVWPNEFDLWEHTAHLKVVALTGPEDQRLKILKTHLATADIVCVSYALLPWLHGKVKRERWDWLIVEESSAIKNHETKRWKAVAYTALTAKRRTILTGTPTPRSLIDLWGQVTAADLGRRFGRSPDSFRTKYFVETDNGWALKPGSRQAISARLKDFAMALRASDYLDMPPLIETAVPVQMPPSAWDVYEELTRTFQAELDDGLIVDVANAGVMAGKLQQIAQGSLIVDDEGSWQEIHTAKIDATVELVNELQGEPVLIAYWYRHDLARLRARFPEAPVLGSGTNAANLNALIDRWNRGEIPALLLHPASAGHGLNLQAGGRHLIWMATPWSWELVQQTTARLYRQGQKRPVMVYRITAVDTIDERIARVLSERQSGHDALVAALKAEVREKAQAGRVKDAGAAMQAAHPDKGGTVEAFIAARKRFEAEKRLAGAA